MPIPDRGLLLVVNGSSSWQQPVLAFHKGKGYRLNATVPQHALADAFEAAWSTLDPTERRALLATAAMADTFTAPQAVALMGEDDDAALHRVARRGLLERQVVDEHLIFRHHTALRPMVRALDHDPDRTVLAHLSWVADSIDEALSADANQAQSLQLDLQLAIQRCPPTHPQIQTKLTAAQDRLGALRSGLPAGAA